jgi:hypothetical protein
MAKRSRDTGMTDAGRTTPLDLDEAVSMRRLLSILRSLGFPTTAENFPTPTFLAGMYQGNRPDLQGFKEWAVDPLVAAQSASTAVTTPTNGTVYLTRIDAMSGQAVSNVHFWMTGTASNLTSGQCFAAVFDLTTGAQLGVSASAHSLFAGTSPILITVPLTASFTPAPGAKLYAALVLNGTGTNPTLRNISTSGSVPNAGLTAATARGATNATSQTTMPSTITTSSNTAVAALWAALS